MSAPETSARILLGVGPDEVKDRARQAVDDYREIVGAVFGELTVASLRFPPMHSMHEGWAILREEVDELWDEVKANNREKALAEAQQVAAMALRFIHDMQALGTDGA